MTAATKHRREKLKVVAPSTVESEKRDPIPLRRKQAKPESETRNERVAIKLDLSQAPLFDQLAEAAVKSAALGTAVATLREKVKQALAIQFAQESVKAGHAVTSLKVGTEVSGCNLVMQKTPKVKIQCDSHDNNEDAIRAAFDAAGLPAEKYQYFRSLFEIRDVVSPIDLHKIREENNELYKRVVKALVGVLTESEQDAILCRKEIVVPNASALDLAVKNSEKDVNLVRLAFDFMACPVVMSDFVHGEDHAEGSGVTPLVGNYTNGEWSADVNGLVVTLKENGIERAVQACSNPHHAENLAKRVVSDKARRDQMIREHPAV